MSDDKTKSDSGQVRASRRAVIKGVIASGVAVSAAGYLVYERYGAGGRISGSATVVGKIVYFADLGDKRTFGLGISTGRVMFTKDTGSFDPVISDGQRIYHTMQVPHDSRRQV